MNSRIEIRPGRSINVAILPNPTSQSTLFLIHGLGGSSLQWRSQIAALKDKHTLIIPDLLGHGQSDKPKPGKTNPYSFIEFSLDLQALFNKYAGEENIVIGHSYGGSLATNLTYHNQSKIKKLVLIAPTNCQPKSQLPAIYGLPAWLLEIIRPYLQKQFQDAGFAITTDPALIAEESAAGKNNRMYVIKATIEGMKTIPTLDVSQLAIPTLIIGGQSDRIIPVVGMIDFYNTLPTHRFCILERAAHLVMLEQATEVNELIEKFISDPM